MICANFSGVNPHPNLGLTWMFNFIFVSTWVGYFGIQNSSWVWSGLSNVPIYICFCTNATFCLVLYIWIFLQLTWFTRVFFLPRPYIHRHCTLILMWNCKVSYDIKRCCNTIWMIEYHETPFIIHMYSCTIEKCVKLFTRIKI